MKHLSGLIRRRTARPIRRLLPGLTMAGLLWTFVPQAPAQDGGNAFATGLTNPRHIRRGPDGFLYVAEAGIGGELRATCEPVDNAFTQAGPYRAGYSGRVSRILWDGTRETVAEGLPSAVDGTGEALGPTDLAWIGTTLYVLIEGGGCSRGLPGDPAGIVRINDDGTYTYVADISAFIRANPVANEPLCGPQGDCEPDGVPHSLLSDGRRLYVVETNHSSILRIKPKTGAITRLADLSAEDPAPIVMIRDGNDFLLGGFDGTVRTLDRRFAQSQVREAALGPVVGMSLVRNEVFLEELYVLETYAPETPWAPESGRVTRIDSTGQRHVETSGLNFPIGMAYVFRPISRNSARHELYVTTGSYGQGPVEGQGQIVRVFSRARLP